MTHRTVRPHSKPGPDRLIWMLRQNRGATEIIFHRALSPTLSLSSPFFKLLCEFCSQRSSKSYQLGIDRQAQNSMVPLQTSSGGLFFFW